MTKKTGFAEWLLIRRCGTERAAEIVGDLYEQHGVSGSSRRILQICFTMSWRWIAAVLLTPLAVQFCAGQVSFLLFKSILFHAHHNARFIDLFNGIFLLNILFWSVTFLSAFRYGFSDRITRVGLACSGALAVEGCVFFMPHARLLIGTLFAAAAIASIFAYRRFAKALLGIAAVAASEAVVAAPIVLLQRLWMLHNGLLHNSRLVELFFLQQTLCTLAAAWVMAKVHRRLYPPPALSLAQD